MKVNGNEPNKEAKESNDSAASVVVLTQNPITSSSKKEISVSDSESKSVESSDFSVKSNNIKSHRFNNRLLKRSLPIPMRSIDPIQCTDILDDMYDVYFNVEVK